MLNLEVYNCNIQKRPSSVCKTPYVADGLVEDGVCQIHTPALGVVGCVTKTAIYWLLKMTNQDLFIYRTDIIFL